MKIVNVLATGVAAFLALTGFADAQSSRRLKPLPVRGRPAYSTAQANRSAFGGVASLPWQRLNNQPTFDVVNCYGAANPLLLTDGTVLVQDGGCQDWLRLTPDNTGSYVNGTWSHVALLPAGYSPLYHSSAVLADGRVIIEGGEYNFFNPVWTNLGAIYDPKSDKWTPVAPPSDWSTIGDAQSVVLEDGTFMQANCCSAQSALLNPTTLTWTATGSGKFDPNDEEGWTLLPNKQVLAVDGYVPIPPFSYDPAGMNSEIYVPASGKWNSAGDTVMQLWDSAANCGGEAVASFELGPAVLRPDGTVFATGANSCGAGHTAIYNSSTGTWTAGPDFPGSLDIADGPTALLPTGNVLSAASPGIFNTPTYFFEFDGVNLNSVPGPPNAPNDSSFYDNMLILPTGQILLTDFSNDIEIYTANGTYNPAWAPVIQHAPSTVSRGTSYVISGRYFNGFSQGAAYGDDAQAATNYPLVRITNNATGHVFYSRTHDHSSMAVAFGGLVSTNFDVPSNQETGASHLVVVANGISSSPVALTVQ